MPAEIKIDIAKQLAKDLGYSEIIIYGYDKITEVEHLTTYGKSKDDCEHAAETGNDIKRLLGWPEDYCNAKPSYTDKEK